MKCAKGVCECSASPHQLTFPYPRTSNVSRSSGGALAKASPAVPACRSPLVQSIWCSNSASVGSGKTRAAWNPAAPPVVAQALKSVLNRLALPGGPGACHDPAPREWSRRHVQVLGRPN
jgi:hypothetical protein